MLPGLAPLTPAHHSRTMLVVRWPGQPREYLRTYAECGYEWRVPRSAARRRIRSISMISVAPRGQTVDRAELNREITSISAANQPADTFRHCPKCGATQFAQRSVPRHAS